MNWTPGKGHFQCVFERSVETQLLKLAEPKFLNFFHLVSFWFGWRKHLPPLSCVHAYFCQQLPCLTLLHSLEWISNTVQAKCALWQKQWILGNQIAVQLLEKNTVCFVGSFISFLRSTRFPKPGTSTSPGNEPPQTAENQHQEEDSPMKVKAEPGQPKTEPAAVDDKATSGNPDAGKEVAKASAPAPAAEGKKTEEHGLKRKYDTVAPVLPGDGQKPSVAVPPSPSSTTASTAASVKIQPPKASEPAAPEPVQKKAKAKAKWVERLGHVIHSFTHNPFWMWSPWFQNYKPQHFLVVVTTKVKHQGKQVTTYLI